MLSSPVEAGGIETEPLYTEPRPAALPIGHTLTELSCQDLAASPSHGGTTRARPSAATGPGRDHDADGTDGPDGPVVADPTQLLEVVALGQAVALVPQHLADFYARSDIAYRPAVDASPYEVAIAWPEGSHSPAIAQFVRAAIELSAPSHNGRSHQP